MTDTNLLEAYIYQRIRELQKRIEELKSHNLTHPCDAYLQLYSMYTASIDQLYICLTAYSNPLENELLFTKETKKLKDEKH